MQQRHHDPRAARPDRVSERYRAAMHVDLIRIEAQKPIIGDGDDGEGLVDLKEVDRVESHARVRDRRRQRLRRCRCEPRRLLLGVAIALDDGEHLAPVALGGGARHEQHTRGAVGDGGGVRGGHGPVLLLERRPSFVGRTFWRRWLVIQRDLDAGTLLLAG